MCWIVPPPQIYIYVEFLTSNTLGGESIWI